MHLFARFAVVVMLGSAAYAQSPAVCAVKLFDVGTVRNTSAKSVNRFGNVIGTAAGFGHFLRLNDGRIQHLNVHVPGASDVNYRNALGTTVGDYVDTSPAGHFHGYRLTSDGITTLIDYPGAEHTELTSINSYGSIVGVATTVADGAFLFELKAGRFTKLNVPGSSSGGVITDTGIIAGTRRVGTALRGFALINGKVQDFNFPGASNTTINDMNATGMMVGMYDTAAAPNQFKAYIYKNGVFKTVNIPGMSVFVSGVNGFGEITGSAETTTVRHGFTATCN